MGSIDALGYNRAEERWIVPQNNLPSLIGILDHYKEITYPKPWVETIYFAGRQGVEEADDQLVPLRQVSLSLKARRFMAEPNPPPIYALPMNGEVYRFEAKFRPVSHPLSPRRRKFITHGTLSELDEALYGGKHKLLSRDDEPFPYQLMPQILSRMKCKGFSPIGAVQYLRRHFINDGSSDGTTGQRMTLDTHVSTWDIDFAGYNEFIAARTALIPNAILEVKNQSGIAGYPRDLARFVDGSLKNQSKHDMLFDRVGNNTGMNYEGANAHQTEGWMIDERELKLDLDTDPRPWLSQAALGDDLLASRTFPQNSRQQFFRLDDPSKSACVMEYIGLSRPNQLKVKRPRSGSGSVASRDELSLPDSRQARTRASEFLGIDLSSVSMSPRFERQRVIRSFVHYPTGRVFEVAADHCVPQDGDSRSPLNQVEVEYVGTHSAMRDGNPDDIPGELGSLRDRLHDSLRQSGLDARQSQTTKANWISK